jgi:hypothetical protein
MRRSHSVSCDDGPQHRWQREVTAFQQDTAHAQLHPAEWPAFHGRAAQLDVEAHLDGESTAQTLPSAPHPGEVVVKVHLRSSMRTVC